MDAQSITYVAVRLCGDRRRIILRVTTDNPEWLSGVEVDKHGDDVTPNGYDRRLRIIQRSAIASIAKLSMNLHYAELEPAR